MKQFLFLMVFLPVFIITSCSSDEDNGIQYSEKQQKILDVFHGSFRYDNKLGNVIIWSEIIEFTEQYPKPKIFTHEDYLNDEVQDAEVHGKCFYTNSLGDRESKFYYISTDGTTVKLYGDKDNKPYWMSNKYILKVTDVNSFTLLDTKLSLLATCYFQRVN